MHTEPYSIESIDGLEAAIAINQNPHARRELLWLRAKEKRCEQLVEDLESCDPGIVDRLRADLDIDDVHVDWADLYDQRFVHHAARLGCA